MSSQLWSYSKTHFSNYFWTTTIQLFLILHPFLLGSTFFLTQTDLEAGFLLLKLLSCLRFYLLHFNNPLQILFLSDSYPTLLFIIVSINTSPQHMWRSRKLLLSSTDLVKECHDQEAKGRAVKQSSSSIFCLPRSRPGFQWDHPSFCTSRKTSDSFRYPYPSVPNFLPRMR